MKDDNVVNLSFKPGSGKSISAGIFIALVIGFVLLSKAFFIVNAGERAVIFNAFTGVENRTLSEGMHFLIPGIQTPTRYSIRTESYTMSGKYEEGHLKGDDAVECLTSDGQKVKLDLSVIYSLVPDKVWELHKQIGPYYLDKIIRPTVRSVSRNIISNFSSIELYMGNREDIQSDITEKIKSALSKYNIISSDTLIRNIIFSDEFAKSIEQKQVALQQVEREKREKERKIIEAEGEAISINKKGQALKANPQLIQYEYVQKLTPGIKTIITNQSSIMNFPADMLKD